MNGLPAQALVRRIPRSYVGYYVPKGKRVDGALADRQHQQYLEALGAAGLSVSIIPSDEALPDCVFIEDTAIVWESRMLVSRMCPEREGEQAGVEAYFSSSRSIARLPAGATLDGGDILHTGEVTYVGLSTRTNAAGALAVEEFLAASGRRVVTIPVSHCLHLKTGATWLGNGTLLAVPGWFDLQRFDVERVIETHPREAGAANCLRIRDHLLSPAGYPKTASVLRGFAEQYGLTLSVLDISEFEKGDGGLTCLSIIW